MIVLAYVAGSLCAAVGLDVYAWRVERVARTVGPREAVLLRRRVAGLKTLSLVWVMFACAVALLAYWFG